MNCKRCATVLEQDEKRNCMYCPVCHPANRKVAESVEVEHKYLDNKPTEDRVIAMIKDIVPGMIRAELENWHNPKEDTEVNWRDQARSLGISLNQESGGSRKKADVLADIAAKTEDIFQQS